MASFRVKVFSAQSYDREFLSRAAVDGVEFVFQSESLNNATVELARDFEAVCLFVNDVLTADMIKTLADKPNGLRLVLLRCAGFNNVDVDACVARNVRVMRVPTYSPHAVAEFAWSTLLTLVRKVHKANARLKEQNFSLGGLIGGNINGKVVGVVGTGAIGRVFAQIASGFGCKILAFDVFPDKTLETSIPSFKYVTLDEVVQQADFVSLHVPLLPSTKHLVNAELLRKFKKGSILVNTSRGALVDTKAVIGALQSKVLGGYCADVYEKESTLFFQDQSGRILEDEFDDLAILNSMANVILTSHCAFFTTEAMTEIASTVMSNISAFKAKAPISKTDVTKS